MHKEYAALKKILVYLVCIIVLIGCTKPQTGNFVTIDSNYGKIVLELNPDKAPITVANFLSYIDEGFYNETVFHRVIPQFMIQGGGFLVDMQKKSGRAAIKNEADNGLKNMRGTIAMARTSSINSATSQFFINHADNGSLDHNARNFGYAVFGKVIDGMDVVDKIATLKTFKKNAVMLNVPVDTVVIKKVYRGKP
jgi:cyclophilin family peptidyl-prolyl cis-trans isomerase